MKTNSKVLWLIVAVIFCDVEVSRANLNKNFYRKTCPQAEDIVRKITWNNVAKNPNLPAKLLRMIYHDCFVRGCDASILLNSTANNIAEKDSPPNRSLVGYDVIDDIKAKLELVCPGIVSCADIVALAARDSVSFQYKRPLWKVLTGRRDGRISRTSEVLANIPPPTSNFSTLNQSFASKGLSDKDLVILTGAHTIGVGHCNLFSGRLFDFDNWGSHDPSLNPQYAEYLKDKCMNRNESIITVEMDPNSSLSFDNHYYTNLMMHQGLFVSDATLITNKFGQKLVNMLAKRNNFLKEFAISIVSMSGVEVLTGNRGEIRKQCSKVN